MSQRSRSFRSNGLRYLPPAFPHSLPGLFDRLCSHVSKRRQGLFKKAEDVSRLSHSQIALIVFSPAGKPYSFGNPSVDAVIDQFLLTGTTGDFDQSMRDGGEGDSFWWDNIDMKELDSIKKLQAVKNGLLGLKQNVLNKIQKLTPSSSSSSTEAAGTTTDNNYLEDKAEDPCMFLREGDGFCWPSDDELAIIMNEDHHDDDDEQLLPPLTDHQEIDSFLEEVNVINLIN